MSLVFFVFGPLLILTAMICADARGGDALVVRLGAGSEGGLRYVVLLGFIVSFVGRMVALAR